VRLLLIRHGQTPANVEGILETTVPGPGLTALGAEQAAALPAALAHEHIDAMFVSTMVRTHETAAPLAEACGLTPVVRAGIREISAGDLEGRNDDEAVLTYVRTFLHWAEGDPHERMPGGEDGHELLARFDEVVAEAEALDVPCVAFVSHGAVIRAWSAMRADNIDAEFIDDHYVLNTGVVVLEGSTDGGWTVESWLGWSVSEAAATGASQDHSPASEILED
jgi:broad specificity phosphatase PhoE